MVANRSNTSNMNGHSVRPEEEALDISSQEDFQDLDSLSQLSGEPDVSVANSDDPSELRVKSPSTHKMLLPVEQKSSLQNKWSNLTIRLKATFVAIALGTIPVVAIGGGAIVLSNNTAVQNIEAGKQAEALELSNTLNAFLFERYSDIEALSNLPSFSDSKIIASQTSAQKSALLTKYADTYGIYDSIAAFDLNGNVIAQSRGPRLPNHANRPYFQQALQTGQRVVGSPQFSESSGVFAMYYATPLKNSAGKITGVIRARMPMQLGLKDLLKQFNNDTNEFYLGNSQMWCMAMS